jgi:hypothetical protein
MFPSGYKKILKLFFLAVFSAAFGLAARAQKIDSIFFNLYTDSLKKGTYNYINVDGKTSEGNWLPLTSREIKFRSSAGKFDGNSLFIDSTCKEEKIVIKVCLIDHPEIAKETTIYIKKLQIVEKLKTKEEFLNSIPQQNSKKRT